MNKCTALRSLLEDKDTIIRLIGACNGLNAKIGELTGFDGIWASGFEISSSFCVPDANILSMSECLQMADIINRSVSIPVIADCDSGFGDLNNVIHLVKLYESRGVAGICIEDKQFPKVNSFIASKQHLVSIEDFAGKLLAAKNAKTSAEFLIIARIEALISGAGMQEALKRAYAYENAGADAILIHSKSKDPSEIFEFSLLYKGKLPLIIVPTTYYNIKISDIENTKIKVIIYANHGIRSSVSAIRDTFRSIITNGSSALVEDKIASMQELFELQEMHNHNDNYQSYSNQAQLLVQRLFGDESI